MPTHPRGIPRHGRPARTFGVTRKNAPQRNAGLTSLRHRAGFGAHWGEPLSLQLSPPCTFPQTDAELAARENKPTATLRALSGGVIGVPRTRRGPRDPGVRAGPPPSPRLRGETSGFRFAGGPPSTFCPTFPRIPAGRDGDAGGHGRPVGHSGRGREGAGGQPGGGVPRGVSGHFGTAGARAEVRCARPATLKPVPGPAPWRP